MIVNTSIAISLKPMCCIVDTGARSMSLIIDLTKEDVSCIEHPIIKLVRILNDTSDKEITVVVSKDDIASIKILEMIAEKMKFKVVDVFEDEKIIKAKLVKE